MQGAFEGKNKKSKACSGDLSDIGLSGNRFAMTSQFTIHVKNEWKRCRFLLSTVPRQGQPAVELIDQAFQSSPPIEAQADGSSTATFKIDSTTIYAIIGTTSNDKAFNTSTLTYREVKLGPGGSVVGIKMQESAVVWDDSTKDKVTEEKGAFTFMADGSIRNDGKGESRPLVRQWVPVLCLTDATQIASSSGSVSLTPTLSRLCATPDTNPVPNTKDFVPSSDEIRRGRLGPCEWGWDCER